jgi:hypothetical protein
LKGSSLSALRLLSSRPIVLHLSSPLTRLDVSLGSFPSLYQCPRNEVQEGAFGRALGCVSGSPRSTALAAAASTTGARVWFWQMGDLYASMIGTTVLRIREVPPCPAQHRGKVCVYSRHALRWERLGDSPPSGTPVLDNAALAEALTRTTEFTEAEWSAFAVDELRDDHVVQSGDVFFKPAGVGEASLRTALERFGEIVNVDPSESPALVRFSTHEAARAAARGASELNLIAGGIATLYNERSYDGRRGEAGRDDDDGRGW